MIQFLIVGAGGFIGAASRYGVSLLVRSGSASFPSATLAVNVLGCFLIGALLPGGDDRPLLSPSLRLLLVVGMLGGFTTFSAFGHETLGLIRRGASGLALAYVASSLLLGLAAVWLGRHARF